jgi:hypothetical protein
MRYDKTILENVIASTAVTLGVLVGLVFLYAILGLFTGVYGICATASREWEDIYEKLIYLIPIAAMISGIVFYKHLQAKPLK